MFGDKFLRTGTTAYLAGLAADLCYFLSGDHHPLVQQAIRTGLFLPNRSS